MNVLLRQRHGIYRFIAIFCVCSFGLAAANTATEAEAAATKTYDGQIESVKGKLAAGSCRSAWDDMVSIAADYPHEDRVYALIAGVFALRVFSFPRDSLFLLERGIVVPALLLASASGARQDEPLTPDKARKSLISILKVRTQESERPLLDCLLSPRSARICADEAVSNRRVATRDEMLSNMRLLNNLGSGVQCYGIRREIK